jgi:hypothetical protein
MSEGLIPFYGMSEGLNKIFTIIIIMKLVIRTIIFHIVCILVFATLYYNLADSFDDTNENKRNKTFLDYVMLAVTIQCGVGFSFLDPITFYTKLLLILQQLIMISAHVITIYIFTL